MHYSSASQQPDSPTDSTSARTAAGEEKLAPASGAVNELRMPGDLEPLRAVVALEVDEDAPPERLPRVLLPRCLSRKRCLFLLVLLLLLLRLQLFVELPILFPLPPAPVHETRFRRGRQSAKRVAPETNERAYSRCCCKGLNLNTAR